MINVAKFFDKMMDMMNLNDYDDESAPSEEQEELDTLEDFSIKPQFKSFSGGRETSPSPKVVNFQANVQMEVVILQPTTYDEAQEICNHIKSKRPVIINLESMDRNIAQRIMDFVSGSCYTLNGNLQRVTNNIFIIAPENVDIAGDFREELKSNGIILPWKGE
jgi:cell division inhibitor SepF